MFIIINLNNNIMKKTEMEKAEKLKRKQVALALKLAVTLNKRDCCSALTCANDSDVFLEYLRENQK